MWRGNWGAAGGWDQWNQWRNGIVVVSLPEDIVGMFVSSDSGDSGGGSGGDGGTSARSHGSARYRQEVR